MWMLSGSLRSPSLAFLPSAKAEAADKATVSVSKGKLTLSRFSRFVRFSFVSGISLFMSHFASLIVCSLTESPASEMIFSI